MRDDIDSTFFLGAATGLTRAAAAVKNDENNNEEETGRYLLGYTLLIMSLVCLGSWPAFLRLSSFPSLPRSSMAKQQLPASFLHWLKGCKVNRDARFSYIDYALSYGISSSVPLLLALATGSSSSADDGGYGDNTTNSPTSSFPHIVFAIIGGTMLSIGNVSMQWATTVFGAPLTTVVAIQASLTVLLGTTTNYLLEPSKTPHPHWLLSGVITFWIAIALATKAHLVYGETKTRQQQKKKKKVNNNKRRVCIELANETTATTTEYDPVVIGGVDTTTTDDTTTTSSSINSPQQQPSYGSLESNDSLESRSSLVLAEEGNDGDLLLIATTPTTSQQQQQHSSSSSKIALFVAAFGGCCFGFFSPCFNLAVSDPLELWVETHNNNSTSSIKPLSVPVANLWFSLAFTVASFVGNVRLLYKPLQGFGDNNNNNNNNNNTTTAAASSMPTTTLQNYFCMESIQDRKLSIVAGLLCGLANLLQFQGGRLVGFATADLVQAFPLVSTVWDVVLFGEFRNDDDDNNNSAIITTTTRKHTAAASGEDPRDAAATAATAAAPAGVVMKYIGAMYIMYTLGIGFLIASSVGAE